MENQLSFFDQAAETWEDGIRQMLDDVIKERGLPDNSLVLREQVDNVNSGEYIVLICEPDYPYDERLANKITENPAGIRIKPETVKLRKGYLKVEVLNETFINIEDVPDSALDPGLTISAGYKQIDFKPDDPAMISFVRDALSHRLDNYTSAAKSFGCCSKFEQCSDAKRCVHENVLYASACTYYWHLKDGKIFYGKNKNV